MTAKLTIFDCDGVLVDSEIIACRVESEELATLGIVISPDEFAGRFIGSTTKTILDILSAEFEIPIPPSFRDHLSACVDHALAAELQPIPGIHALLEALAGPVCVVSNSSFTRVQKSLRTTRLFDRFSPHLFSGANHVERPKPAPDIYLHAAGIMNVDPADCLVIEDTGTGVTAAVAAGMPVIGFTGGSHSTPGHGDRLLAAGASTTVETMTALAPLLPRR